MNTDASLPFISVIIPVYNAEKYIQECLDSVCGQTLRNIEIICVDDGSSDGSAGILREYASKDRRISVITQPNAGAGAARNRGMAEARGDYLVFIDSDDFWKPQLLEKTYEQAKRFDADLCLFLFEVFNEKTNSYTDALYSAWYPKEQGFRPSDHKDRLFQMTPPGPCFSLYRRSMIEKEKLAFLTQHIAEDIYFVFLSMAFSEKICTVRDVYAVVRRGMDTNLSSALWKYPRETHSSLLKIRSRLEDAGLYEMYRKTFRTAALSSSEYVFSRVPMDVLPEAERLQMLVELGISDKPDIIAFRGGEAAGKNRLGKIKTIQRMVNIYGVDYAARYFLQKIRTC